MEQGPSYLQGDLLVDVLRTDSANLLDIDGLADFLDDWMEDGNHNGQQQPNGASWPGGSGRLVTTTSTIVIDNKEQVRTALQSKSSGESSENTKASRAQPAPTTTNANQSDDQLDGENARDRRKRTRNQQQMEHNRVAQQKYRERKKMENSELQKAVDLLTAELAAMKALEFRASEMETANNGLLQQVLVQQQQLQHLESKVVEQEATIVSQARQLDGQLELLTSQQKMILDQHQKLQLQEEIILSLKDRLKESLDRAYDSLEAAQKPTDCHTICRKMHEAVRQALTGATDIEGLQETLAKLPENVVVEICKNIMVSCREMFPELMTKAAKCLPPGGKLPVSCSSAAGHVA